jgi:serine phosphatase RsbU (regulator of sigma subunit)
VFVISSSSWFAIIAVSEEELAMETMDTRNTSGMPMPSGMGMRERAEVQTYSLEETVERRVQERTASLQREYEHEHCLAQTLQRALLLTPPLNSLPGLTVETVTAPAAPEVLISGDFCDAFSLSTGEVALVVGDVCGKGLVAAVRVPEIKFALRAFLSQCPCPDRALSCLNDWLCTTTSREAFPQAQFATLALVVLNPETGLGMCSLAGADAPLLLRPLGSPDRIKASGMALGVDTGWFYESCPFFLGIGDLLLMTTDGITEARQGNIFLGEAGVTDLARQSWQTAQTPSARGQALRRGHAPR